MKVREIMTTGAKVCMPETSLAAAAALMWEHDCGALPVVNVEDKVVGMVTDRDICIGVTTKNRRPSEVSVGEVVTGKVFTCAAEDDIHLALHTMQRERVRRLPVVGDGGRLEGVVSLNDVVLKAEEKVSGKAPGISYGDVLQTYKAICTHPIPARPAEEQPTPKAARA